MVPLAPSDNIGARMAGFTENKFISSLKIDPLLRSYQVIWLEWMCLCGSGWMYYGYFGAVCSSLAWIICKYNSIQL